MRNKVSSFRFQVSGFKFQASSFKFNFFQYSIFNIQYSIILILLLAFSCRRSYNTQMPADDTVDIEHQKREILLRINQEMVEEEAQAIKKYAENQNWEMKTTETGLWYMIYKNGRGEKATSGKIVTLEYTLSLLNNAICYSSAEFGPMSFKMGFGGVESGLEEGVLLLREGDKARFIMPPHLAHGLTGDGDCIPMRAIIIYDVELVRVTE